MMTDRALSLFRTVMHPVLSNLPSWAGGYRAQLPAAPHFAVPAIQLGGVILHRSVELNAAPAEAMYGGEFCFAGSSLKQLPDMVFSCSPPSSAWRAELLRMDWLASFRSSPKSLHGLYALRLISAWISTRPNYVSDCDQITALYNLAVDAPAIASRQSPAAVAIATAAVLQAQHAVSKMKPQSKEDALARSIALLAAHLACKRPEAYRSKLVSDVVNALSDVIDTDGSHCDGNIAALHQLHGKLETILGGLSSARDVIPPDFLTWEQRLSSYLALLARPDGQLAFCDETDLKLPRGTQPRLGSAVADKVGHARLVGGRTLLLANLGCYRDTQNLQIEVHDATTPLLWLQRVKSKASSRRGAVNLMCAKGGSLLEMSFDERGNSGHHISIFLSSDGADLRLEETPGEGLASAYVMHVPDHAKLTTINNGSGAMLVIANVAWQLMIRGGRVAMTAGHLHIQPDGEAGKPLNFALKRGNKPSNATRLGKAERDSQRLEKEMRSPRLI